MPLKVVFDCYWEQAIFRTEFSFVSKFGTEFYIVWCRQLKEINCVKVQWFIFRNRVEFGQQF